MHIIFIYIYCCLHIPKLLFSFESLIPGLGRSPGEGKGYPLQYSGLENSMDCTAHAVAELDTTGRISLSLLKV